MKKKKVPKQQKVQLFFRVTQEVAGELDSYVKGKGMKKSLFVRAIFLQKFKEIINKEMSNERKT